MDLFSFSMGLLVGGSVSMLGFIADRVYIKKKIKGEKPKKEKKCLWKRTKK